MHDAGAQDCRPPRLELSVGNQRALARQIAGYHSATPRPEVLRHGPHEPGTIPVLPRSLSVLAIPHPPSPLPGSKTPAPAGVFGFLGNRGPLPE
jgi:hypothetical protein